MKKIFPLLLIIALSIIGYFFYKQWVSPDKPVIYNPPLENTAPEKLEVLPVEDLNGNKNTLSMKDTPYTFFIFLPYSSDNSQNNQNIYSEVNKYKSVYNKNGIRVVYLWYSVEDNAKEGIESIIDSLEEHSRYWLTKGILKEYYEKYGVGISMFPFFLGYNQSGELLFQADSIKSNEIAGEIIQLPIYDKNDFKRVIKRPGS